MDSEQLVLILLALIVVAQTGVLLYMMLRWSSAALSINADWREGQRLRLDTDRAEFMLREAREKERNAGGRAQYLRPPGDAPDISTGTIG